MARSFIPLPKLITDETGHTYGRLTVIDYAGTVDGKAGWNCVCECGGKTGYPGVAIARGDKLRTGRIVSCGCWRADTDIRQAARLQVPAKKRRAIAKLGQAAWQKSRGE